MRPTLTTFFLAAILIAGHSPRHASASPDGDELRCQTATLDRQATFFRCLARCSRRADAAGQARCQDACTTRYETRASTHGCTAGIEPPPVSEWATAGADALACRALVTTASAKVRRCTAGCRDRAAASGSDAALDDCHDACEVAHNNRLTKALRAPVCVAIRQTDSAPQESSSQAIASVVPPAAPQVAFGTSAAAAVAGATADRGETAPRFKTGAVPGSILVDTRNDDRPAFTLPAAPRQFRTWEELYDFAVRELNGRPVYDGAKLVGVRGKSVILGEATALDPDTGNTVAVTDPARQLIFGKTDSINVGGQQIRLGSAVRGAAPQAALIAGGQLAPRGYVPAYPETMYPCSSDGTRCAKYESWNDHYWIYHSVGSRTTQTHWTGPWGPSYLCAPLASLSLDPTWLASFGFPFSCGLRLYDACFYVYCRKPDNALRVTTTFWGQPSGFQYPIELMWDDRRYWGATSLTVVQYGFGVSLTVPATGYVSPDNSVAVPEAEIKGVCSTHSASGTSFGITAAGPRRTTRRAGASCATGRTPTCRGASASRSASAGYSARDGRTSPRRARSRANERPGWPRSFSSRVPSVMGDVRDSRSRVSDVVRRTDTPQKCWLPQ